ncbi:MAG: hypothetical protein O3B31_13565 [Chloroflexi bacterium]|nr:hypothetical protein [Chloroflexota bacterium]MDA1004350.1 hypothetical protein [Chloroflexota bacterium]MQC28134.1 hypothetical protein [Chloroflexota bacterium]
MPDFRFEREARTPYSEQWTIESGDAAIGRFDVHFTSSVAYATLAVHTSVDDEAVQELIAEIDDRIVMTADPYREDFVVTVWRGEQAGVFAEDADDDADEDDEYDDDDEVKE